MGSSFSKNGKQYLNKPVTLSEISQAALGPSLEFSKSVLDFSTKDEACPLNVPVYDEVVVKNVDKKSVKFKFEPVCPASCKLSFSPSSGSVGKGKEKRVKVMLILLQMTNLNFKVTLRTRDGAGLFLNLRVSGETGVFGVDPGTLEQTDDGGFMVPKVLVEMKNLILSKHGEKQEGIFRVAGEQTEILRIKGLMNKKVFDGDTKDVNAVASLLKIWFRDLPVPILNALSSDTIMNFSGADDCVNAFKSLPEPQKSLVSWLLDFLVIISKNSEVNKMTAQNLAIVVAPNLYDISTPNPMEGLILSQKCAQFLFQLLSLRISGSM